MARRSYTVKKDDDWFKIATKTNNQAEVLARANPNINTLSAGQVIDVPTTGQRGPQRGRAITEPATLIEQMRRRRTRARPGGPRIPVAPAPVQPAPRFGEGWAYPPAQPDIAPPTTYGEGWVRPSDYTRSIYGPMQPGAPGLGAAPPSPITGYTGYRAPLPPTAEGEIWMPQFEPAPYDESLWTDLGGGGWYYDAPAGGFTSIIDYLSSSGRPPLTIRMPDVMRLGLTPLELTAAGYVEDDWGNWSRRDVVPEPSTEQPSEPGIDPGRYFDYARRGRGGGGGGRVTPTGARARGATRTGRQPRYGYTGTGRRVDQLSMGLIKWRI